MDLCLVPLALDKFEVCCVPTDKSHHACWRDASEEVVAEFKDGSAYYMPVCNNPEHIQLAQKAKEKLLKGVSLAELEKYVVKMQMFVKPTEIKDAKVKVTQWENFKKRRLEIPTLKAVPEPQQPKQAKQVKKTFQEIAPELKEPSVIHTAYKKWEWVDDIGGWMDIEGNLTTVAKLSDKELKHTVLAIKNANFKSVSPKISWTKFIIINDNERFIFPEEALKVGAKIAAEKLEDFRIECRRRGYV
jgi:hypothetical protein